MAKLKSDKKVTEDKNFPIVAIGASTGGLEAMSILLKNLPSDSGMAFICVQHLSPDHKSFLAPILAKTTKMKVQVIEDMEHMAPNNVYVIPNNKEIEVTDGHIKLMPRPQNKHTNLSIDVLFSSLAITHKEFVIGVVLSGNASDGTKGLEAIKEYGGITFAQDGSAQADSMPKSAIAAGVVDFVLPPEEIAFQLALLSKNGFPKNSEVPKYKVEITEDNGEELKIIFEHLHKETGVDFSHYKLASIQRRLNHRMLQSGVKYIKDYLALLLEENNELDLLYKDLLINVTSFFRDTEVFNHLKSSFLPKLLKDRDAQEPLRIWVPACSTGEEAYSIAMILCELQANHTPKINIQIFATDLSVQAIRAARIGEYSLNDLKNVSKQRLEHFFTKSGDNYLVVKELRDMCVFAPHNILRDPPFSRMDLISCRNLLIYFDSPAQKKTLATIHFALKERGYLMLGKSESTGPSSQFFSQEDNKFKIYSRIKHTGILKVPVLTPRLPRDSGIDKNQKPLTKKNPGLDTAEIDTIIDSVLLAHYMPDCAIINKDMEILQFRGSTTSFLTHPSGKASLNILKMIQPEFAFELRNAINKSISSKKSIIKSGIEINIDSAVRLMSLEVRPLKTEWQEPLMLIVFNLQDKVEPLGEKGKAKGGRSPKDIKIAKLTDELQSMRAEMNAILEAQEITYEELQIANEEIVSTNEEFQTLNEELETSKEEIESTNEELISTNHELQLRNDLLAEANNYSQAIFGTIHEPLIILDNHLNVKSANKSFYRKFNISEEESEGKNLFDLADKQLDIPELRELLDEILGNSTNFRNVEISHIFPGAGEKTMLLNARLIIQKTHKEKLILLAIEDISERLLHDKKEKELLKKDIGLHEENKLRLEKAVSSRTKQLAEKILELEKVNKDLTSFTFVSSHDLQEPLRKIQNFVSYLVAMETANLSVEGKKNLEKIYETSRRMRRLLDDLLIYSRTSNSAQKFEKTNLNDLWTEVTKTCDEIIISNKTKIDSSGLGEAKIMPAQFTQVLQNLLTNSVKFARPSVKPQVVIKSEIIQGDKKINENLSPELNYCHISYTDNGIGFDPQYKDRIFEVFQRLHSADQYEGTGMGLAICKLIIDNHHGIITATGKLGKGAQFDIYIPD